MPHALLADDDALVRYVLRCALEQRGFLVHEAADGDALVRRLSSGVDLVMMDDAMPGPPLAARLEAARLLAPAAAVVVMSGTATAPAHVELGGAGFLPKPVGLDALDAVVERLGRATAARVV